MSRPTRSQGASAVRCSGPPGARPDKSPEPFGIRESRCKALAKPRRYSGGRRSPIAGSASRVGVLAGGLRGGGRGPRRASRGRAPRSRRSSARPRSARGRRRGSPRGRGRPRASTWNASWVDVVAEEAVDAVADDLRQAADPAGDDGRAAGQRLDRDEAERLRPRARHERGVALGEQRVAVGLVELAQELDVVPGRLERRLEDVRRSRRARAASGRPWRRSSAVGRPACAISMASTMPFSGATRPTKHRRVTPAPLERRAVESQPVVDDAAHGDIGVGRRLVRR